VVVRTVAELRDVPDPAWPDIERAIRDSGGRASVLAVPAGDGERCLHRLQVTARSALGAVALHAGAVLVDHGWLRILGGGHPPLPSLADANRLPEAGAGGEPPSSLQVARDVLGGIFSINGGGLPGPAGEVCYFGPDTLSWQPLGTGHTGFLTWAVEGGTERFYADLRWEGWEDEVRRLPLDHGLSVYPPLYTAEADPGTASRHPVPWDELARLHADIGRQLDGGPSDPSG
jgi:hypothetical protein